MAELTLNSGTVKVESTTLKLDDVTVSGTTITEETTGSLVQVDGSGHADAQRAMPALAAGRSPIWARS